MARTKKSSDAADARWGAITDISQEVSRASAARRARSDRESSNGNLTPSRYAAAGNPDAPIRKAPRPKHSGGTTGRG